MTDDDDLVRFYIGEEGDLTAEEWLAEKDGSYTSWEVNRQGDTVFVILSNMEGSGRVFTFAPTDALDIGMAMAQAAQEPTEEKQ